MDNFFSKFNKSDINSTYNNPYKFLTSESSKSKISTRLGDLDTTLWMETAGLTVYMSLIMLLPSMF